MFKFNGWLGRASAFLLISAILHIIYFILTGFSEIPMLIAGVLYIIFAIGLGRGMRWLAYIVFVISLMGIIISFALNSGGFTGLLLWAISFADLGVVIALFIYIWNDKPQSVS